MNYQKLLLNELRYGVYEKGDGVLTDEGLAKAVTLNENLKTLGYALAPADLARLGTSPSLDGFYQQIADLLDKIPVPPMYPGFPQQVMDMEEAVFRFHQGLHYFSTYGLEALLGVEIEKGWLPEQQTEEVQPQERVLEAKILTLLEKEDCYIVPLTQILSRRERMTLPEKQLVTEAVTHVTPAQIETLSVPFKENLKVLYEIIFDLPDREEAFRILQGLCRHTGDVLNCVKVLLGKHRFHFRTSQKRFLVKLIETYPVKDLRANLVLSGKGAQKNLVLLNHLDYSVYSRSDGHMQAVNDLRDGKLRSWESQAKALLSAGDQGALDFIASRPGVMLRMVAWLLRLGYSQEAITEKLSEHAAQLSMQTLVTTLNYFGKTGNQAYDVFEMLLRTRMRSLNTELRGKTVRLEMGEFLPELSEIRCNEKSADGGYFRSGLAYRLPEKLRRLRFFVYWNDERRVDVDLHVGFTDRQGEFHRVGWNNAFRDQGVYFSGDITHSNAAEYIDIDLTAPIDRVYANVHLFSGKLGFDRIETCYVGIMAVPNQEKAELYSEANCFFKHDLRQSCSTLSYGHIDVPNRALIFDGKPREEVSDWYGGEDHGCGRLSLRRYLDLLLEAQEATLCDREDADVVLVMGKAAGEKEVSLIDANFFME